MIERLDLVRKKLKELERQSKSKHSGSVVVGYTAAYALYVHENTAMKWKGKPRHKPHKGNYWDPPGRGQAKFLEQPFREHRRELLQLAYEVAKRTGSLRKGLLAAGLLLQRMSQQLVPVDTGNLKASAFTAMENELGSAVIGSHLKQARRSK